MPRPVHFEISADDTLRATKFFSDVFGWTFQGSEEYHYYLAETRNGDEPGINGAIMRRGDAKQAVTNSISVPSIDDFAGRITRAGGEIIVSKMSIPGIGYSAYFKDTEGNIHGLFQEDPGAK
ncbi:MAG: VOC family protein [Bacteroidota bacterium]|nr:VOC family protein [Bacteroidota bacterium]MDP4229059.1 VOC family protein [Bacteroidota bacterium]MDP4235419.1 VOC family protein [Bacteroidota bacterium]